MLGMFATVVSGHTDLADLSFLIAVLWGVLAIVLSFVTVPARVVAALGYAAVTAIAFGLLVV